MFSLHGTGVGSGIAIGEAYVVEQTIVDTPGKSINRSKLDSEITLLESAVHMAVASLVKTRREIPKYAPKEIAAFLDAHTLMVEDPTLTGATVEIMKSESFDAETALMIHRNDIVKVFDEMEDEYLRSKRNDVDQVIQLILRQLRIARGEITSEWEGDLKDRILVAHDLTPADTVQFKKLEMSGFVTNLGSPISHVAILARSLRIPAVVGLHGSIRHIEHGAMIAVDSRTGTVVIDPDEEVLEQLKERRLQDEIRQQQLSELLHLDSRTEDGHEVTLLANVEVPSDIDSAATSGADGVGLYRTEYLFMNRTQSPSEKEQFEAYSNVVKALGKVTIRTLDLGADKQVDGGRKQGKVAINPALGVRAVRFCLRSPGIFRTQLRAIFRASVFGSVQCLIPMLSNLEELNQVMVIIDDVKSDLDQENVDYDASVPIGGMIEVPAAAILADQFAERLGFLSIGTNDLIQYTLAIDRVDDEVNYLYDPLHLSILRLVKYTIEAGAATGTPVTMCGEMAGDGIYTRLLLGLGLRNFSMDPAAIPEVKHIIRNTRVDRLKEQVEGILRSPESAQRVNLLSSLNTDQDIASYLTHGS